MIALRKIIPEEVQQHFEKKITKNQGYIIGCLGLLYGHYFLNNIWDIPLLIGGWIAVDALATGLLEGRSMIQTSEFNTNTSGDNQSNKN